MKRYLSLETKVLLVLLAMHLLVNSLWLYVNNLPPSWDAAAHTTITLDIAQKLRQLHFLEVLHSSNYYPIFVHTIAAIGVLLGGPSIKLIQFTGSMYFVLAIACLYLYAMDLTKSKRVAIIAACLFSFCPIVFSESRRMMLDIPLTSIVLLSLLLLQKSNYLKNPKWSILFFASLGILLLTKWTGLIFLFVPFIFSVIYSTRNGLLQRNILPIILGAVLGLAIALPWYLINLESLRFLANINSVGERGDPTQLLSIENGIYYLQKMTNYITTPVITVFFLVSLGYLITKKSKHGLYLLLQFCFCYLVFTFIQNKDARYLIPLVPTIVITVALFLDTIVTKLKQSGLILTYSLLIVCFSYFMILTVRPELVEGKRVSLNLPIINAVNVIDINDSVVKRAYSTIWPNEDIIANIVHADKNVIVAYETEAINPSTLSLNLKSFSYTYGEQKTRIITPDPAYLIQQFQSTLFPNRTAIEKYLQSASYVITSPNSTGVEDIKNVKALEQIRDYVETSYSCNHFISSVTPVNTFCFVSEGEVLKTGSDVLIDGKQVAQGNKVITGSATVRCPWGCSFTSVTTPNTQVHFEFVKKYLLTTGEELHIFKRE